MNGGGKKRGGRGSCWIAGLFGLGLVERGEKGGGRGEREEGRKGKGRRKGGRQKEGSGGRKGGRRGEKRN